MLVIFFVSFICSGRLRQGLETFLALAKDFGGGSSGFKRHILPVLVPLAFFTVGCAYAALFYTQRLAAALPLDGAASIALQTILFLVFIATNLYVMNPAHTLVTELLMYQSFGSLTETITGFSRDLGEYCQ